MPYFTAPIVVPPCPPNFGIPLYEEGTRTWFDLGPLVYWVNARHRIYLRKMALEIRTPPPQYAPIFPLVEDRTWTRERRTDDPILNDLKFCNAFRELDKGTIWIRENIREPFADHPFLWLMLGIGRQINRTETLAMLINTPGCWPSHDNFSPENMTAALNAWQDSGEKVYTGAYMIRAENQKGKPWYSWRKNKYMSEIVVGKLWQYREFFIELLETGVWPGMNRETNPSLYQTWSALKEFYGWGPFMSGQAVTDMRHTRYLDTAYDRADWAAVGPGSARGLNRLIGRDKDTTVDQLTGLRWMRALQKELPKHLGAHVPQEIELTDIQSMLCETDKYLRVKNGEGKTRAKYEPRRSS